jgi:ABC-2 type transport system permease protein
MYKAIEKYQEIAKINFTNSTTYITNVIVSSFTVLLRIWIFTQLYQVTYQFSGVSEINGLDIPMVIWVLALTQSFRTAISRQTPNKLIEEEVISGTLAYTINRPYSYLLFHYFGFLGKSIPFLIPNLIISCLACLIFVGPITLTLSGILFAIVLLLAGTTIDYLISVSIALLSFWVEDVSAFRWIYSKGQMVLGGNVLPLALFPDYLRHIAEILPFSQLYYTPAQMLISPMFSTFSTFFIIQIIWITIFSGVAYTLFHKGVRNVSINGG